MSTSNKNQDEDLKKALVATAHRKHAEHSEYAERAKEEYILFACHVNDDGLGDLGHFVEISNYINKRGLIGNAKPIYLVCYGTTDKKQIEILQKILTEAGFDLNAKNLHFLHMNSAYTSNNSLDHYLQKSIMLQEQLKKTKAMFSISMAQATNPYRNPVECHFLRSAGQVLKDFFNLHGKKIPCISLYEHGARPLEPKIPAELANLDRRYFMGFNEEDSGVLLSNPNKSFQNPVIHLSDRSFLKALLGIDKNAEEAKIKSHIETFKKRSLLIPCYFQEGPAQMIGYMNAIASSPLAAEYDEIVFVTSNVQTYANRETYKTLLIDGVPQITITNINNPSLNAIIPNLNPIASNVNDTIPNLNQRTKKPNIRVIENVWLSEKDKALLYQAAPIFGGCSGDKSFETTLSYGLLPYHQKKGNVMAMLSIYIKEILEKEGKEKEWVSKYLDKMLDFISQIKGVPGYFPEFHASAKELGSLLTPDLLNQWKNVVAFIKKDANFYNFLPNIVRKELQLAEEITLHSLKSEVATDVAADMAQDAVKSNANEALLALIKNAFDGDFVEKNMKVLLEQGANPKYVNEKNETALSIALQLKGFLKFDVISMLIKSNFDINAAYKFDNLEPAMPALHYFVSQGNNLMINFLLSKKETNVNQHDSAGNTALHLAITKRDPECVKLLLERQANPNLASNEGTPLQMVYKAGSMNPNASKIANLLLEHGAKPVEWTAEGPTSSSPSQTKIAQESQKKTAQEQSSQKLIMSSSPTATTSSRTQTHDKSPSLETQLKFSETHDIKDVVKKTEPPNPAAQHNIPPKAKG